MNCNEVRENMIDVLAGGLAAPEVMEHFRQCNVCATELESMRKTMSLLDEWEVPEPSPYFLTRLNAHVREERGKAPASGLLAWMRRPALAVSLAAAMVAGSAVYTVLHQGPDSGGMVDPAPQGTAVADVEVLDRNHEVLVNTDLLDELSGNPSQDVVEQP